MLLGVCLFMILIALGVAYDFTKMVAAKSRMQDSVDLAALAGASIARKSPGKIKTYANKAFVENAALIPNITVNQPAKILIDQSAKEVTVSSKAQYEPVFLSMFKDQFGISASSTTGFAIEKMNPFAVYLALDVSGSMSWPSSDGTIKVEALKQAVSQLFTALLDASENKSLLLNTIRSGYASYNTVLVDKLDMANGFYNTLADVNKMTAVGGTNSTPAFQYAYNQLKAEGQGKANWTGYLVFMTDGDNNDPAFDTQTLALCAQAKADKINIYTVAFEAPQKGKDLLLACASSPSNAYTSENAQALQDAFIAIGKKISSAVVRIKR